MFDKIKVTNKSKNIKNILKAKKYDELREEITTNRYEHILKQGDVRSGRTMKWFKLLIASSALSFVLAGCGSDDTAKETKDTDTKTSAVSNADISEENPLKFSEDAQKSNRLWYVVEVEEGQRNVGKDSIIERVIEVDNGKAVVWDNLDEDEPKYKEIEAVEKIALGDLSKADSDDPKQKIQKQREDTYQMLKQVNLRATEGQRIAYGQNMSDTELKNLDVWEARVKKDTYVPPVKNDYKTFLFTDDSGNNVESEKVKFSYVSNQFEFIFDTRDSKKTKEMLIHEEYTTTYRIVPAPSFDIYDKTYMAYFAYDSNNDLSMLVSETTKENSGKTVTAIDGMDLKGAEID